MGLDRSPAAPGTGATRPFAPGRLLTIANGPLVVTIAPQAGGRIAQITYRGEPLLVEYATETSAMIAWGSYPMVPWAGRVRDGCFDFQGNGYQLPLNLDEHAIHGVGFGLPWRMDAHEKDFIELSLALPNDERWPFGGEAGQRIEAGNGWLRMKLWVRAVGMAMPVTIGWHPWFRKPERLDFTPGKIYPRDRRGIATTPCVDPTPGPWDDCFINTDPVLLHYPGQSVRLLSDCEHWVVYDETTYATCAEPQSGPPDSFNIEPTILQLGQRLERNFLIEWTDVSKAAIK